MYPEIDKLPCACIDCKEPQTKDEYCDKHQFKLREEMMDLLNLMDEWADGYTSSQEEKESQMNVYTRLADFIQHASN